MLYNLYIDRIGNPVAAHNSEQPEPIVERASSKLQNPGCAGLYAATKPKARSTMGFLLCAVVRLIKSGGGASRRIQRVATVTLDWANRRPIIAGIESCPPDLINLTITPQSGLANGLEWAALKKHRLPRKGEPEKTGDCRGPAWKGRAAGPLNDSLNGDVGRQGRACGVHQPLFKSSEFDKEFSGIRLNAIQRNAGVSPNPCIRQLMGKQKAKIARIKMRSAKFGRVELLRGKSPNEIAADLRKSGADFLASSEWKAIRVTVIERYGAKCMCCGNASSKRGAINVDHIKPRKYFPELALVFDNLQVLCGKCNKAKGNKHMTDYRNSTLARPMA